MKTKVKKATSLLLVSVMAMSLLAGCGGSKTTSEGGSSTPAASEKPATEKPKEDVKLEFWTISLQPTFNDYFNNLIAAYEGEHPNVKIDWKDFPYDAIQNKLLTSIASDQAPAVVNLNTELANQMGSKNALVDFNAELTAEQKGLYFDGIYNSTVVNGKGFALPWYTGLPVLFLNKDLVEKAGLDINNPPKTNDELHAWAKQMKEKANVGGYTIRTDATIFVAEGVPLLSEDNTKAAFNTPEAEKIVASYVDLINSGAIPKEDANYDKQVQYYVSEQVGMTISNSSFINRLKTTSEDIYKKTVAVPAPVGKGDVRFSSTMNIAVPSATKHKDEAVDFALFVTNAANQLDFSKKANTLPSTKDSIKDAFFTNDDGTLEAKAKIASAQSLDKASDFLLGVKNAGDIRSAIGKKLQNVYLNGADIKKELTTAEKDVNDILEKNK